VVVAPMRARLGKPTPNLCSRSQIISGPESTRTGRSTLYGADIIGVSACRDERTLNGHARDLCADQSVTLEKVIGSRLEVHALGDW